MTELEVGSSTRNGRAYEKTGGASSVPLTRNEESMSDTMTVTPSPPASRRSGSTTTCSGVVMPRLAAKAAIDGGASGSRSSSRLPPRCRYPSSWVSSTGK